MSKGLKTFAVLALLGAAVLVVIALAQGGKIKDVGVSETEGLHVSFDNSAVGSHVDEQQLQRAQPDLEKRVEALERQANAQGSGTSPGYGTPGNYGTRQVTVNLTGTWRGNNGFTYQLSQYGNQVVIREVHPAYGITAVGYGYVNGNIFTIQHYQAASGTVGDGTLTIGQNILSGGFRNYTYGYSPVTMQRV